MVPIEYRVLCLIVVGVIALVAVALVALAFLVGITYRRRGEPGRSAQQQGGDGPRPPDPR